MAVKRGIVANVRHSFPTGRQIDNLGATVVRSIVYSNDELEAALQDVPPGVEFIALLNSEHEEIGHDYSGWSSAIPQFADRFRGRVHAVEMTNEWDLLGIPANVVANLVMMASPVLQDAGMRRILGAVASEYWQDALTAISNLLPPDAYDEAGFHPYGQYISALGEPQPKFMPGLFYAVLRASHLLNGKKIAITEFGAKLRDYGGANPAYQLQRQVEYVRASFNELDALPESVCDCACYFTWRDDVGAPHEQGPDAFGLMTTDGEKRPAWDEYRRIAKALPKEIPMAFTVGEGVLNRMKEFSDAPATDELYHPIGAPTGKHQYSETFGKSGRRYVYIFSTNQTVTFSPTS